MTTLPHDSRLVGAALVLLCALAAGDGARAQGTAPPVYLTNALVAVGATPYTVRSTAAVLTAQIHGSSGWVWKVACFNRGAAEVFMRLYDQTGAPGTGDGANIKFQAPIPGDANAAGFINPEPNALTFTTGIGIRVTGAVADTDATALVADEVVCNVSYQDTP